MTVVGFQVVRLRPHADEGYEVVPAMPFLGEEADDAREELAASGPYAHRPVVVHGLGPDSGPYVAAFPVDEGEPLLELDDKGNPLPASDTALRAVEIANEMIEEGTESPAAAESRLREIWELLGEKDTGLRELLFERLYRWAEEESEVEVPPTLFWLLPWPDFIAHLGQLAFLIRHTERSDLPPSEGSEWRLPEISHSFKYLIPGLAPSLREITEWRDPGSPIVNLAVRMFSRRLRMLIPDKVPPDVRGELCKRVEDIGRSFQRRVENEWLPSMEHILAAQVTIDLYEILLQWQAPFEDDVDAGRIKWLGRLALAANAGHFDAGKVRLRQQTIDALREMATRLQEQGLWFEDRAEASDRWWDRILDAGYVLYVSASKTLTVDREPSNALALAHAARGAFERFGEKVPNYRAQRWANVLPEAHLLEARSAIDVRDYRAAGAALLAIESALDDIRPMSVLARKLYHAQVLLYLDQIVEADPVAGASAREQLGVDAADLSEAAARLCEEVIEANFAYKTAWRLLIPLVPAERAAAKIEDVLGQESTREQQAPQQETLEWLEYQLAVTARQRADEMPELLFEAFESYAGLLASQPRNLPAVEELLEMYSKMQVPQEETARRLLDELLVPISSAKVPSTHAAVRWAIAGEAPDPEPDPAEAHAIPLIAEGTAPPPVLEAARSRLEGAIAGTRNGRRLLEMISKWVYDRARASGDRARLSAVGRLLDPAISADPSDAIWWSRRADVALTLRDTEKADALLEEISSKLRNDAIARFQIGRLRLLRGEFAAADEELIGAECLDLEQTGEATPYPAIADRRGFIALLEGRYPDAERQYRQILGENRADPAAHYGLGRVYLQSPAHSPREAMHHWRVALRLRITDPSSISRPYAWRTAAGIAGLIGRNTGGIEADQGAGALHEELEELLAIEDAVVGECLVKALSVRGVTDARTAEILQRTESPRLARAVAQHLMARTIHLYIESPSSWPGFFEGELPRYLEWCEERSVLGDFLAGAKGSYARAHIRAEIAGQRAEPDRTQGPIEVSARKLKKLVDHVVETSYSARYYEDAYAYLRSAGRAKDEQMVAVVNQIVSRLTQKLRSETAAGRKRGGHGLLAALWPSVGLEAVGPVLEMADDLTAYVDLDALRYARAVQNLDRWQLEPTQLVGWTAETIPADDRRSYARAGLGWEVPSEDGHQRCVVDLIDTGFEGEDAEAATRRDPALAMV